MLDMSFSFVLAYPTDVVSKILDNISPSSNSVILDPFCGTGTTLVECKRRQLISVGIESNPVCVLAARAKTQWHVNDVQARDTLDNVVGAAKTIYSEIDRKY